MNSVIKNTIVPVLMLLLIPVVYGNAQEPVITEKTELYQEIRLQDSLLFAAFNNRDLEGFKKYFSTELEFYHDKGGLTGYDHTINFLKETTLKNNQLKRELVKGSLEVFPIPGYGAMEIGSHRFCHMENGKEDCGNFKFVQIWQKKDGQWIITRVISYDH